MTGFSTGGNTVRMRICDATCGGDLHEEGMAAVVAKCFVKSMVLPI